jgi:hypothetical protein
MIVCFRLNRRDIDYLIQLTESFPWEELSTVDPDTGNLTMSGFIFRISNIMKISWALTSSFHLIQSSIRMVTSHSMVFTTWYPFDASVSPLYEIVNLTQVI